MSLSTDLDTLLQIANQIDTNKLREAIGDAQKLARSVCPPSAAANAVNEITNAFGAIMAAAMEGEQQSMRLAAKLDWLSGDADRGGRHVMVVSGRRGWSRWSGSDERLKYQLEFGAIPV